MALKEAGEEAAPARGEIVVVIEGHDDCGGAAQDLAAVDRAPETGVVAVVAIVAHDEVAPGRDCDGPEGAEGGALGQDGERMSGGAGGGFRDVDARALVGGGGHVAGDVGGEGPIGGRLAVDQELFVGQFNLVAGKPNDALDEAFAISGGEKDDDVAALRIAPFGDVPGCEGNLEIVGELVDEDAVALDDGWVHGAAWDVVPIGDGAADSGQNEDGQKERPVFAPEIFQAIHWSFDSEAGNLFAKGGAEGRRARRSRPANRGDSE